MGAQSCLADVVRGGCVRVGGVRRVRCTRGVGLCVRMGASDGTVGVVVHGNDHT